MRGERDWSCADDLREGYWGVDKEARRRVRVLWKVGLDDWGTAEGQERVRGGGWDRELPAGWDDGVSRNEVFTTPALVRRELRDLLKTDK